MRPLLAAVVMLAGCDGRGPLPPREFDGPAALRYIETQLGFGPRIPGSEGHRLMAVWLDSLLRIRADSVEVQRWTHVTGAVESGPLAERDCQFQDCFANGPLQNAKAELLRAEGLRVSLPPWGAQAWRVMLAR